VFVGEWSFHIAAIYFNRFVFPPHRLRLVKVLHLGSPPPPPVPGGGFVSATTAC
jgi:hypothetical protein